MEDKVLKDKVFLLGVGCQKGGTTWLHAQLSKNKEVNMGFRKEYHIFDALYLESCRRFKDNNKNNQIESFYSNIDNYFNYFENLFNSSDDIKIVGDITPSYSGLPVEVFEHIKLKAEEKGFTVKVVFLMRDPIERIWSSIRMQRRDQVRDIKLLSGDENTAVANKYNQLKRIWFSIRMKIRNQARDIKLLIVDENTAVANKYKNNQQEFRTNYKKTILNIESVFDNNNIFYGFYETLFTNKEIEKIENFLSLKNFTVDFKQKVNVSKKYNKKLSEDLEKEIANYYKDTYVFCDSRFKTSDIWKGYKYLGA